MKGIRKPVAKSTRPKLIAVVGATATGKTSLAVNLAIEFDGEVVNGDSRLFYRGLDIATAKPTSEEKQGVPHHLLDFLDPDQTFSLAEYLEMARSRIAEITSRGKMPIVAGGSGQYVWALLEGWDVPEVEPNHLLREQLENQLEEEGIEALALQLQELAPQIAESTDLKNPRRVIRAIERVRSGLSEKESTAKKATEEPFECFVLGLSVDRNILHERVLSRLHDMISNGWKSEVESLLKRGYSKEHRSLSGIGYPQMIGHISGDYDINEAVRLTAVATNRLIRHQNNWFKQQDPRIHWFDMSHEPSETTKIIHGAVADWIDK